MEIIPPSLELIGCELFRIISPFEVMTTPSFNPDIYFNPSDRTMLVIETSFGAPVMYENRINPLYNSRTYYSFRGKPTSFELYEAVLHTTKCIKCFGLNDSRVNTREKLQEIQYPEYTVLQDFFDNRVASLWGQPKG
jgi:hypothetical protein